MPADDAGADVLEHVVLDDRGKPGSGASNTVTTPAIVGEAAAAISAPGDSAKT